MLNTDDEAWVEEIRDSDLAPNEWTPLYEEWRELDSQFQEALSTAVEEHDQKTKR